MPLIEKIEIENNTQIFVWKVTETIEELKKNISLSEYDKNKYESIKLETHKKNFLITRLILKDLGYLPGDLLYNTDGKPFLKNKNNISISHSFDMLTLMISPYQQVGVDIEKVRDKITRIAEKFTQWDYQNTSLSDNSILQKLTMIWTAKEATFKLHGKSGVTANDIFVKDFFPSDTKTNVKISHNGANAFYKVNFKQYNTFVLAYAYL